ncbi:phage major capsid protein [Tateyamaria sp.]|uniref:phage major capsid protein n=1 Tax=Tateyamaria sp. TaxID=1929288 RepID=UPI00329C8A2E
MLKEIYARPDEVAFRSQLGHLLKSHATGHTTIEPEQGLALVDTVKARVIRNLTDTSIFGQLATATDLVFEGAKVGDQISFPYRKEGTLPDSFVSEGSVIPVREGQFEANTLRAYKMAVISVFSEQLAQTAIGPMRAILSRSITQDTAVATDALLLSDEAGVPGLQPQGLQHGLTPLTPVTGGTKVEDTAAALQALSVALIAARATSIAIIMSTTTRAALMLQSNANGQFVWKDDLLKGEIAGMKLFHATTVPDDRLIAVDPQSLGFAFDDPDFVLSGQATIVMVNDADTTAPFLSHTKPGEPGTPDQVPGVDQAGSIEIGDVLAGTENAAVKSMMQRIACPAYGHADRLAAGPPRSNRIHRRVRAMKDINKLLDLPKAPDDSFDVLAIEAALQEVVKAALREGLDLGSGTKTAADVNTGILGNSILNALKIIYAEHSLALSAVAKDD